MSTSDRIRFACSACNSVVSTAVENAGKRAKCHKCGAVIQIPKNQLEVLVVEQQRLLAKLAADELALNENVCRLRQEFAAIQGEHSEGQATLQQLRSEIAVLEENLEDISYGIYRPHFTFQSSEEYKSAITTLRNREKQMVRAGEAATCSTTWSVGGSEREGTRMIKQYQKLLLRAFNGEADAAIAKATWSNFRVMQTRIRKAHDAINKMGTVMHVAVCVEYRDLKLEELRLTFEYDEKKQQEREEQRRIKAQIREEERVQRELERVRKEAEEEEQTYEEALAAARKEAETSIGAERDSLAGRIEELERQLQEAHEKRERAISMAQLTKRGYVYIISNVGSFGEQVYKIGMTRRQRFEDRVKELGDASVPFPFDVHAKIYSENAPELECQLQTQFWDRRLNRANERKEFFRVTLEEIEAFVTEKGLAVKFTQLAEAKEFRQTVALLADPLASNSTSG